MCSTRYYSKINTTYIPNKHNPSIRTEERFHKQGNVKYSNTVAV